MICHANFWLRFATVWQDLIILYQLILRLTIINALCKTPSSFRKLEQSEIYCCRLERNCLSQFSTKPWHFFEEFDFKVVNSDIRDFHTMLTYGKRPTWKWAGTYIVHCVNWNLGMLDVDGSLVLVSIEKAETYRRRLISKTVTNKNIISRTKKRTTSTPKALLEP